MIKWKLMKTAPKDKTNVLLFTKSKNYDQRYYIVGYYDKGWRSCETNIKLKVSAWVELPQPPYWM